MTSMDGRPGGWLGASLEAKRDGQKTMTNETWGEIRENLVSAVGKNNYVNWIEPLEFHQLRLGPSQEFLMGLSTRVKGAMV